VDVAWSPYGIDGRNYDILGVAAAADLLFVMAYDMQSQVAATAHSLSQTVQINGFVSHHGEGRAHCSRYRAAFG